MNNQIQSDVKNACLFISEVIENQILPFFNGNNTYSANDLSVILAQFLAVQNSLLSYNQLLDDTLTAIEVKIQTFNNGSSSLLALDYREVTNPNAIVNPLRGVGAIWLNLTSGELFVCTQSTNNQNIWRGSNGSIVGFNTRLSIDPFNDGSCVARFPFNNNYTDLLGLTSLVIKSGSLSYFDGKFDKCCFVNATLQIQNNSLLPLATQNMSFGCFFRPDNNTSVILSRDSGIANSLFGFRFSFDKLNKVFTFKFPTSTSTAITITSPTVFAFGDNNLHYVGFSIDRQLGRVYLYVDNEIIFIGTGVPMSEYNNGFLPCFCTLYTNSGNLPLSINQCYLQQVSFFNRFLTAKEHEYLYMDGMPA